MGSGRVARVGGSGGIAATPGALAVYMFIAIFLVCTGAFAPSQRVEILSKSSRGFESLEQ